MLKYFVILQLRCHALLVFSSVTSTCLHIFLVEPLLVFEAEPNSTNIRIHSLINIRVHLEIFSKYLLIRNYIFTLEKLLKTHFKTAIHHLFYRQIFM